MSLRILQMAGMSPFLKAIRMHLKELDILLYTIPKNEILQEYL